MIALHGFLGAPTDFARLAPEARAPNWLPVLRALAATSAETNLLPSLAAALLVPGERELLGYSMGGRIALQMLVDFPDRWSRAAIVSASPGSASGREPRLAADRDWAARFRSEPWPSLMAAWNGQAVFAADPPPARSERSFDREALALALERGSVALQDDLRPALRELATPILWLAGTEDPKYLDLAAECAALNPRFAFRALPGGHRAPWTSPGPFRDALREWGLGPGPNRGN